MSKPAIPVFLLILIIVLSIGIGYGANALLGQGRLREARQLLEQSVRDGNVADARLSAAQSQVQRFRNSLADSETRVRELTDTVTTLERRNGETEAILEQLRESSRAIEGGVHGVNELIRASLDIVRSAKRGC